jgi:GT2 family glycosyltransferase
VTSFRSLKKNKRSVTDTNSPSSDALGRTLVDLITFTYNRLAYTRVALTTLAENTASYGWEWLRWIIVENASVDGTREYVREFKASHPGIDIDLVENERPRVVAANMNLAIGRCRAPFIAKVDNDMLVPPLWLDSLKRIMDAFRELAVLGGGRYDGDKPVERNGLGYYPVDNVGGNFLARAEPLKCAPIESPVGEFDVHEKWRFSGFSAWQWQLRETFGEPNVIAWAYPYVDFRHMDDPHYPYRRTNEYQSLGWGRWGD